MKRLLVATLLGIGLFGPNLAGAAAPGAFLGDLSWPEAEARLKEAPVVVLPFGPAAKEHGPHLPLNADAKVMEYVCVQAVASPTEPSSSSTSMRWLVLSCAAARDVSCS